MSGRDRDSRYYQRGSGERRQGSGGYAAVKGSQQQHPQQQQPPRYSQEGPPPMVGMGGFDPNDRAPEDRTTEGGCATRQNTGNIRDAFDLYDSVVSGTLHVEGVNYSKYESCKDDMGRIAGFLDALKDDLISEVGNGVRREDIKLRVYPGAIKTVVLHYDEEGEGAAGGVADPRLVDAEWSLKVDYGIRARDPQRQQNIAIALYSALTSRYGFSDGKTQNAYRRFIDRTTTDVTKIVITKPKEEGQPEHLQLPPPPAAGPRPVSPTRTSFPLPMQQIQQQPQPPVIQAPAPPPPQHYQQQYEMQPYQQPQPQIQPQYAATVPRQDVVPAMYGQQLPPVPVPVTVPVQQDVRSPESSVFTTPVAGAGGPSRSGSDSLQVRMKPTVTPSRVTPQPTYVNYEQQHQHQQQQQQQAQYETVGFQSVQKTSGSGTLTPMPSNGYQPMHPSPASIPAPLPAAHNSNSAAPAESFDYQRDRELARLVDEIHKERMKLRGENVPSNSTGALTPAAPEKPSFPEDAVVAAERRLRKETRARRRASRQESESGFSDTHYVTTEF